MTVAPPAHCAVANVGSVTASNARAPFQNTASRSFMNTSKSIPLPEIVSHPKAPVYRDQGFFDQVRHDLLDLYERPHRAEERGDGITSALISSLPKSSVEYFEGGVFVNAGAAGGDDLAQLQ